MNRASMAKQIEDGPMNCGSKKKMMAGGTAKPGYKKGGMAKKKGYARGGKVDQSMCSPRKQMAMGMKNG